MIIIFILRLYDALHMLQLSGYQIKRYVLWNKENIKYLLIYPVLACLSLFVNTFFSFVFAIILLGYWLYFFRMKKVRLRFTMRMMRMIGIITLLFGASLFFPKGYVYLAAFTNCIVLLSALLLYPIERKLYRKYYRQAKDKLDSFEGLKIGITGSYGKTSTKVYLNAILKSRFLPFIMPNSYNTPMGISKEVNRRLSHFNDVAVFELGAAKKGDIGELIDLIAPDISIITAIGPQHLQTFKTMDTIIEEKMSLALACKTVFINISNEYIKAFRLNKEAITFGIDEGDYQARNIQNHRDIEFDVFFHDEFLFHAKTKLFGQLNVSNLLGSIAVAHYLGIEPDEIYARIRNLQNFDHRLSSYKEGRNLILDDSFNANIEGAKQAIDVLSSYSYTKYIITPGFVETGLLKEKHHQELAKKIMDEEIKPILVSNERTKIMALEFQGAGYSYYEAASYKDARELFGKIQTEKCAILLIENDLPDNY